MVRIEDITEISREKKKNVERISGTIRDVFREREGFCLDKQGSAILVRFGDKIIAGVNISENIIVLYRRDYMDKTKAFAERYQFLLPKDNEVVIQTDYS